MSASARKVDTALALLQSGGDYATHRSGAIKVENATGLTFVGNDFEHIGGNAVMLSASVRNVTVTQNSFQWLGTNGVAVQGKTGAAMMDGRDGEAMRAKAGAASDNGVRLPTNNLVSHNVFANCESLSPVLFSLVPILAGLKTPCLLPPRALDTSLTLRWICHRRCLGQTVGRLPQGPRAWQYVPQQRLL